MKYKITIKDDLAGKWVQEEIEAEVLVLTGFENFQFIMHEKDSWFKEAFVISELSTGGKVATGETKRKCIANAMQNLKRVGADGFEKMLESIRQKIKQEA